MPPLSVASFMQAGRQYHDAPAAAQRCTLTAGIVVEKPNAADCIPAYRLHLSLVWNGQQLRYFDIKLPNVLICWLNKKTIGKE
jgi:hypothetical protein